MIWLQRPPWAKWTAVAMLTAVAFWIEVRPDPMTDHPFAVIDIEVGEAIGDHNTKMRAVPTGLFESPEENSHALVEIPAGTPVLASQTGESRLVVPTGWWIVSVEVPLEANPGDPVRVILLDEARWVDGVVSSVGISDGFGVSTGGVAVAAEHATEVAAAAASGQITVLVSTG